MGTKRKGNLPRATPDEAKRVLDLVDNAVVNHKGTADTLEQAIGMYIVGRHVGWKPLVIMHNKRTLRKYEEVLGIDIREEFDEVGPDADRSTGYRIAAQLSNFWKAVSGEEKIEGRKELG